MLTTQNAQQIGRFDKNHQTLQNAVLAAQPHDYSGAAASSVMKYAGYNRIHYPEDPFIATERKDTVHTYQVFAGIACDYHDEDTWLWRHA